MAVAVPQLANLPLVIKAARIGVAVADEADVRIEGAMWGLPTVLRMACASTTRGPGRLNDPTIRLLAIQAPVWPWTLGIWLGLSRHRQYCTHLFFVVVAAYSDKAHFSTHFSAAEPNTCSELDLTL